MTASLPPCAALVTGANKGIGFAVIRQLAARLLYDRYRSSAPAIENAQSDTSNASPQSFDFKPSHGDAEVAHVGKIPLTVNACHDVIVPSFRRPWIIYVTGRDASRVQQALQSLRDELLTREGSSISLPEEAVKVVSSNESLSEPWPLITLCPVVLDVSKRSSVQEAAQQVSRLSTASSGGFSSSSPLVEPTNVAPCLDLLVSNAGIAYKGDAFDATVVRDTRSTNYDGAVTVDRFFIPLLRPNGRLIHVGSRMGQRGRYYSGKDTPAELLMKQCFEAIKRKDTVVAKQALDQLIDGFESDVADGTWQQKGWPKSAYGISKLCLGAWSQIVAQLDLVKERRIRVQIICPGWVRTDMAGQRAPKSPDQGADTIVWLALTDDTPGNDELSWQKRNGYFIAERVEIPF